MSHDINIQLYRHTIYEQNITTLITNSNYIIDFWIQGIRGRPCIIGLGMELVDAGDEIATIQFCIGHRCLIYHLYSAHGHPRFLEQFLADPKLIFVGFGLRPKLEMLGLYVRYVDLHNLSHLVEALRVPASSDHFTVLVRRALDSVDNLWPHPAGSWNICHLSLEQLLYASLHAYISYRTARILKLGITVQERFNNRLPIMEQYLPTLEVHEVRFCGRTITTTVTNRITAVENWIADVVIFEDGIVGFDVEMCTFNGQPYVATVQLCIDKRCLIIQFFWMHGRYHYFPNLQRFLLNDDLTFVGARIVGKMELFIEWLLFPSGGDVAVIDTAALVAEELHRPQLVDGEDEPVTLLRLLKPVEEERPHVETGWDAPVLSYEQVECACINAAASFDTGLFLL